MPPEIQDRSDLVLNPGESAFVQDRSKGYISVNVGPLKVPLSQNDALVSFDLTTGRFRAVPQDQAIHAFVTAHEGSYIVLSNPARDGLRPPVGKSNNAIDLDQGRRVHLNGPMHFPLWPGEAATVVAGHQLRSNQYLLVRVYNEVEAQKRWQEAVMRPQGGAAKLDLIDPTTLRIGQIITLRGTELSFFIPPTGVEVLPAPGGYTRDAVTLERLEYCILRNEDGNKRYMRGPDVVFPEPTEEFFEKDGEVTFRATELSGTSGVYVKVIEQYIDSEGLSHPVGEEQFITGATTPIFFPRQETAIIRYGKDTVHYAVAVPAGEGRYVLNRNTGDVKLVRGPVMLLPDPRYEVITRRILDLTMVDLLYPGNAVAKTHNTTLAALAAAEGNDAPDDPSTSDQLLRARSASIGGEAQVNYLAANTPSSPSYRRQLVAESVRRGEKFSPPRMVTLNTKYDGAVAVGPWVGFAVQVISKTGTRRVVLGPATELLEYDESLSVMELSTGTPKTDKHTQKTVYLRVYNNRVSDIVDVETMDLCKCKVAVSYRVNFDETAKERWFAVENYVRHLTEHGGSRIRNAVKRLGIEQFYANPIDVVRNAILGAPTEGKQRPGLTFQENGMVVYDVEVIDITITNAEIAHLLVGAQHTAVKEALAIAQAEARFERTKRQEAVARQEAQTLEETAVIRDTLRTHRIERERELTLLDAESKALVISRDRQLHQALQPVLDAIADAELNRREREGGMLLSLDEARLKAEAAALTSRMAAMSPTLVEALTRFADQELMVKMTQALAPLAMLENTAMTDLFSRYIEGTPMAQVLGAFMDRAKSPREVLTHR